MSVGIINAEDVFAFADRQGSTKSWLTGRAIPGALLLLDSNDNLLLSGNNVYDQGKNEYKGAAFAACTAHEWILAQEKKHLNLSKDFVYDYRADRQDPHQNLEESLKIITKTSLKPVTVSNYQKMIQLQENINGLERQISDFKRDQERRKSVDVPEDEKVSVESLEKYLNSYQQELVKYLSLEPSNSIVPAQVFTVEGLKRSMVYNGPAVIELPVYDKRAPNGQFWVPPPPSSIVWATASSGKIWPKQGVTVVAFNESSQNFLIRNSWGAEWNGNGHAWISYDYLRKKPCPMYTLFSKSSLELFQQSGLTTSSVEVKAQSAALTQTEKISGGTTSRPSKTLFSNIMPAQRANSMSFLGIVSLLLDKSKSLCF